MDNTYILFDKNTNEVLNRIVYDGESLLELPENMEIEKIDFEELVAPGDIRISKGKYKRAPQPMKQFTQEEFEAHIKAAVAAVLAKGESDKNLTEDEAEAL